MPCRDVHAPFLREALSSVLSQTSSCWRLGVITHLDDPTSPRTVRMALADLGASDHPAITLLQTEGRFVTAALNAGMRHAQTPYAAMLHADDFLARRAVATLTREIVRHPEIDYFHSSRVVVDDRGRKISGVYRARQAFTLADFKHGGPVKHLHCWPVATALAIGGMDESLGPHAADDYDFPWRMAEAGCAFRAISDMLYCYRDHRTHHRLTTHVPLDVQVVELRKILAKHGLRAPEIEAQITRRTAGYLKQALFLDEQDRREKERRGFDIRTGWKERY